MEPQKKVDRDTAELLYRLALRLEQLEKKMESVIEITRRTALSEAAMLAKLKEPAQP